MKRKTNILSTLSMTVATLLLMPSCNSSYPGLDYEPQPGEEPSNDEDIKQEQTPIKIYTSTPGFFSLTAGTRGTGAFPSVNPENPEIPEKYYKSTFHVFAFRTGTGADGNGGQGVLSGSTDLTRTVYAHGKDNNPSNTTVLDPTNTSCLLDGEDYYKGMPCEFVKDGSLSALKPIPPSPEDDRTVYYSGNYQDVGYSFFGYHIDDFTPTINNTHRNESEIYYDIEVDGNQDILLGYAEPITEKDFEGGEDKEDGKFYEITHNRLSDEEKKRILDAKGGYSAYAGHRLIHPTINLRHMLTQLKFKAYPGDNSADHVTITGISVRAAKTGKMTVASRRLSDIKLEYPIIRNTDSSSDIKAKTKLYWLTEPAAEVGGTCPKAEHTDSDDPELNNGKDKYGNNVLNDYKVTWDESLRDTPVNQRPMTDLGGSLLLPTSCVYDVNLHYTFLKQDKEDEKGKEERFVANYRIHAPENDGGISYDPETGEYRFMPGVIYTIKIGVYGLQKIEMSGSIEGWGNGGDIIVDPDNPEGM